jgi:hypothetical protein
MDDSVVPIRVHELTDGMFDVVVDPTHITDIPANTEMYISGNGVCKPVANAETQANMKKRLGFTTKPWKYGHDGPIAVQTKFRNLVKRTAGGTIVAGNYVRFEYGVGAISGQVVVWDPATDDPEEIVGQCWTGGADTETVYILEP